MAMHWNYKRRQWEASYPEYLLPGAQAGKRCRRRSSTSDPYPECSCPDDVCSLETKIACDCGAPRCERDGCQDKPTPLTEPDQGSGETAPAPGSVSGRLADQNERSRREA